MSDLTYLVWFLACGAAAAGFVSLCDRLMPREAPAANDTQGGSR